MPIFCVKSDPAGSTYVNMKIALAQVNPIVGDISGNSAKAADFIRRSAQAGADLVVFAELSVLGYPPGGLLRKKRFVADSAAAVESLAKQCVDISALVGFVQPAGDQSGQPLQNAAALLAGGKVQHVHVKTLLPAYDVFDETRYFQPGPPGQCLEIAGCKIGVTICEDIWDAIALERELYGTSRLDALAQQGAEIIINMAASPFEVGKVIRREELFARQGARCGAAIAYVNQVGGNDELIFDGGSCFISADGELVGRSASFAEDLLIVDTAAAQARREELGDKLARLSAALKLGLRDYVHKCGFNSVVLGLSGGIDSAVVAALAADALGPKNVLAVAMPSRYSSDHSISDAEALAENLGIRLETIPIEAMHCAYEAALGGAFANRHGDVVAENIQARIRGDLVMAMSNTLGHLPLATGNKSELSTGYCTLYGDMCGGLAPIGDVLKTVVYELAGQLNSEAGSDRIPQSIITKPPSAELKPDQVDQDRLPPYDLLDSILHRYIEQDLAAEQIIADGFDPAIVRDVVRMVDASEYKRKQAPPVLKVSPRAFGTSRRMPIAQRYIPTH